MITLKDGPCRGSLSCRKAPAYIRAVMSVGGEIDALDQPNDTAKPTEQIFVYRRISQPITAHLLMSPRSRSGWYEIADYEYMADVDGETVRDNGKWQDWLIAHLQS